MTHIYYHTYLKQFMVNIKDFPIIFKCTHYTTFCEQGHKLVHILEVILNGFLINVSLQDNKVYYGGKTKRANNILIILEQYPNIVL